jgi:hypothetical protein
LGNLHGTFHDGFVEYQQPQAMRRNQAIGSASPIHSTR